MPQARALTANQTILRLVAMGLESHPTSTTSRSARTSGRSGLASQPKSRSLPCAQCLCAVVGGDRKCRIVLTAYGLRRLQIVSNQTT